MPIAAAPPPQACRSHVAAIYFDVIKRRPLEVRGRFNANVTRMAIPVITLAELPHGTGNSRHPADNHAVAEDSASRLEVLPYTPRAARHHGRIRAALERDGRPIGGYDLHVAAHARSEGLIPVTDSAAAFRRVPALQIESRP